MAAAIVIDGDGDGWGESSSLAALGGTARSIDELCWPQLRSLLLTAPASDMVVEF
jgi:hypothetical protein